MKDRRTNIIMHIVTTVKKHTAKGKLSVRYILSHLIDGRSAGVTIAGNALSTLTMQSAGPLPWSMCRRGRPARRADGKLSHRETSDPTGRAACERGVHLAGAELGPWKGKPSLPPFTRMACASSGTTPRTARRRASSALTASAPSAWSLPTGCRSSRVWRWCVPACGSSRGWPARTAEGRQHSRHARDRRDRGSRPDHRRRAGRHVRGDPARPRGIRTLLVDDSTAWAASWCCKPTASSAR